MKLAASRRRILAAKGRTMTLQRGGSSISFVGFLGAWQGGAEVTPAEQGDALLHMTADEVVAHGWTAPIGGDFVVIDGRTWLLVAATPLYDGSKLIGYHGHIKGGQP